MHVLATYLGLSLELTCRVRDGHDDHESQQKEKRGGPHAAAAVFPAAPARLTVADGQSSERRRSLTLVYRSELVKRGERAERERQMLLKCKSNRVPYCPYYIASREFTRLLRAQPFVESIYTQLMLHTRSDFSFFKPCMSEGRYRACIGSWRLAT